jgi:hypothetical protein
MNATYKHIRFEEIEDFTVCRSNHGGAVLGRVEWFAAWKEYKFLPESATFFTVDCLRDLADFVGKMNAARKAHPLTRSAPHKRETPGRQSRRISPDMAG